MYAQTPLENASSTAQPTPHPYIAKSMQVARTLAMKSRNNASCRPVFLQLLVNGEDEGRARYGPSASNAATTIESLQTVLLPDGSTNGAERRPPTRHLLDVFRLHTGLDGIGRVEEEVVGHASRSPRSHTLMHGKVIVLGGSRGLVQLLEKELHAFEPAEPRCRATGLTDERAHLAMPVTQDALVSVYGGYDAQHAWLPSANASNLQWHLHFAFHELDGREEEGGECARHGAAGEHCGVWYLFLGVCDEFGIEHGFGDIFGYAILAHKSAVYTGRAVVV